MCLWPKNYALPCKFDRTRMYIIIFAGIIRILWCIRHPTTGNADFNLKCATSVTRLRTICGERFVSAQWILWKCSFEVNKIPQNDCIVQYLSIILPKRITHEKLHYPENWSHISIFRAYEASQMCWSVLYLYEYKDTQIQCCLTVIDHIEST